MHEFSITQSILSIALEKAGEVNAGQVTRIDLVVGELSGIVDESVAFYFEFLRRGTIAAEASLSFRHPPLQLRCHGCDAVFAPDGTDWKCPACGERGVEILSGRELYVESIEVA